ncbi:MAG TPA: penicillin-binding protein 2 [Woeseiaceae bacterium]|nr:penicillin-binding protein 2 [Woeseiaceae bacterium]
MMRLIAPIKDHHSEKRLFFGRVVFSALAGTLLLGVVIARLIQLQVVEHEEFAEKSQGNRIRIEAVPPIRGLIYDRKGRVLAENLPAYQLELIPEQVPDLDDTLARLARLGLIAEADTGRIRQLSRSGPRFKPVTLRFRLTDDEIAEFALQRPRFQGVDFQPRLIRHYPHGDITAHAIGYVGAITTEDLDRLSAAEYAGTAHTGKSGVEFRNETMLHGNAGHQQIVTNARGRQVPADPRGLTQTLAPRVPGEPGDNIHLTLDLDLQIAASRAMAGMRGSVVAIDPQNGEVLALVSAPAFDPNLFAIGMSAAEFNALQYNLDRPLFNRALRGTYPPGSTIKPMLSLAALETGATNLTRRNFCPGYYSLPGSSHRYRDWKPEGHGSVDLHDALEQSCDVYFYDISRDIGIDRMHFYLTQFGLGQLTGIDLAGETQGLVPSREWKRGAFRERADQVWFPGETVIASIGQGYMLATPLQLANAVAAMATRGRRYEPHIVAAVENALTGQRVSTEVRQLEPVRIDNEFYWESVVDAMHDVMQGPAGTARAVGRGAPYAMAGKSGTAQVFSVAQDEKYDAETVEERLRDHALFIAFAPLEEPRIAVAVVIENGSSGSRVAAPIARAVMDQHLGYGSNALQ